MTMNVTCSDRERIFEDGTPVEWAALEAHAASCPLWAEELRAYSDSPLLWPRIERTLAEEAERKAQRGERWSWFSRLPKFSLGWQTALAGAFALLLAISGGWIHIHNPVAPVDYDKSLLRSSALKQVESAETAYERAIDKLAAEAKPQLENPATP